VSGPLEGVRVLDLTRLLPGNYCTLLLSDLGADVLKVEEPGRGDYIRWAPPMSGGQGVVHQALNRGKRSLTLNLKVAAGTDLLLRLAARSDVLIESFRPGVLDRLGAGYNTLAERNPQLVYCALTGYGQDGPYRDRVGHDINYTGYAGILETTGVPGGPPVLPSVQVGDFAGGMAAAIGVLSCLHEARRTGHGRLVDVSMLDVATSWTGVLVSSYLATGVPPERGRMPLSGGLACYQVYRAADGKYLAVGALEPRFWETLCQHLGLPELVDEQYGPPHRQEEIAGKVQEVLSRRTRDEWVAELAGVETCVGPVNDVAEAMSDPQLVHRGLLAQVEGRPVGPGTAVKVSGHRPSSFRPAPQLGEHTAEALSELDLSDEDVERLRSGGVV
jgi:crotonobetainyl-CoA:carnitine CoA-transferase CaiB-like acyl-CoA transferase